MDAHDVILEQLQRAQQRAVEAVTNRLGFVADSLDELVQEAKASIQEAVPESADELFPVAEITAAVTALREQVTAATTRADALEQQLAERPEPGRTISLELLRAMDGARSQSELLRELLPQLADSAARAVVFVLRGGEVSAWSGIGITDGEQLRSWRAAVEASPVFNRFVEQVRPIHFLPGDDPVIGSWLAGEAMPSEALILPVCLRGKLMGGIYIDHLDDRPWDPDAAQAMVALTCWMIDTLHHRQTVPSPMLAEPMRLVEPPTVAEDEPAAAAEQPVAEEEPPAEAEPEAGEAEEVTVAEPAAAAAPADDEVDMEAAPTQDEGFDPSATVRVDLAQAAETSAEAAPAVAEDEAAVEIEEEFEEGAAVEEEFEEEEAVEDEPVAEVEMPSPPPVSPVVPPPPAEPAAPVVSPAEISPEDEARHEEARRFARLLVSEIKLYNEDEVEQGRAAGDLYHRLKEDIDRSREMYEKRIPPEIRAARDYFHEELVRILADGDPDALGM